jgi:hypothetical protein
MVTKGDNTMKAMMSEINSGGRGWNLFPEADAALALSEARAILAVSEPYRLNAAPGWSYAWASTYFLSLDRKRVHDTRMPEDVDAGTALASALSAFVEAGQ